MTQAKGPTACKTHFALWLLGLAATVTIALTIGVAGCGGQRHSVSRNDRPGAAATVYRVWPQADLAAALEPASPQHPRWSEFLQVAAAHHVLPYDFLYFEGHPTAVDHAWFDASPPSVTAKDFIEYRPAGGWHAADNHFGPAGSVVCYLRLPAGTKIDSSRDEAWRLPLGTELIQFLYRDKSSGKHTEQPVEWRRMRQAGPGRGQMRSDGTRSDWIYEAAVRDAVTGRWKRTREDGRDAVWVRAGFGGRGTTWPVVRPHTCAACHAMAGDSPLDGPRGGHDVYSLGDLREAVWSGQLDRLKPLLSSQPSSSAVAALAAQPKPPEPADRFTSYIDALAKERGEAVVIAKVQQMTLEKSPFQPHDAQAQERGREIFLTQCAACHGKDARGDGRFALCSPVSPSLIGVRPAKLLAAMQEGSGTMPAWSDLLPGDDQWRVIEYLKTLK